MFQLSARSTPKHTEWKRVELDHNWLSAIAVWISNRKRRRMEERERDRERREMKKLYACPSRTSTIWKSSACCLRLFAFAPYCVTLDVCCCRRASHFPRWILMLFFAISLYLSICPLALRSPKSIQSSDFGHRTSDRKWFIWYDKHGTILRIFISFSFATSVNRFSSYFFFSSFFVQMFLPLVPGHVSSASYLI